MKKVSDKNVIWNDIYVFTLKWVSTIWTKAREAAGRLLLTWSSTDDKISIGCEEAFITDKRKKLNPLDTLLRWNKQIKKLLKQSCLSLSKVLSHFLRSGDFLCFTYWKFIHNARLNLLHLNSSKRWDYRIKNCPWCYRDELLPRALNHCERILSSKIR